jgi:hypothetical protein
MHHFVDDDVLKALSRFFGQVGVQSNAGGRWIATPPSRFHPLNKKTLDLHFQVLFPSRDQLRNLGSNLLAIPALQDVMPLATIRSWTDAQDHFVDSHRHRWRLVFLDDGDPRFLVQVTGAHGLARVALDRDKRCFAGFCSA